MYSIAIDSLGRLKTKELLSDLKSADDISLIYEKDDNTIVIGTFTNGLYVYKKSFFSSSTPLPNGESDVFYGQQLLADGQTIFTGNSHLFKDNKYIGKLTKNISGSRFSTLIDKDENFWYTSNKYILRTPNFKINADTLIHFKGLPSLLLQDKQGRVWVSTEKEEFGYFENGQFYDVAINNIPKWTIAAMRQDADGSYYIGTYQGLFTWGGTSESNAKKITEFKSYNIRYIWPEAKDIIWVCTYGNGIFLITKNKVTSFLDNNPKLAYVHCIVPDKNGYFWLPTNNGLFATTKKSLITYSENKQLRPYFYEFTVTDGLRTNEFNGGGESPFIQLPNEEISLPSMKGLVLFNPSKAIFDTSSYPIIVDDIYLDKIEITKDDNFEVGNSIKNIHFCIFSAFWGVKENYILEYQLVKKNASLAADQWVPLDQSGKVNLFAPSSGNYQLVVRKRSGFGENDYTYKTINFQILPQWYQTKWFELARVFCVIGIFIGIFFWRRRYYRKANLRLKKKVDNATFELQQLNNTLEKKVAERTIAVQEAEKKFRTLVEAALVGEYIIKDGKLPYVNPRFAEIFGYTQQEIMAAPSLDFVVHEEDRALVATNVRRRMEGNIDGVQYEARGIKKDSTIIHIEVFGRTLQFEGGPAVIGTLIDITEKKRLEKEIPDQKIEEEKMTIRAILLGEERERNKVGQELHDNINQILAGTRLYLKTAKRNSAAEESGIIDESIKLLDNAIEEIRALSKNKVTPEKKGALKDLLQSLVEQMSANTDINTKLRYEL